MDWALAPALKSLQPALPTQRGTVGESGHLVESANGLESRHGFASEREDKPLSKQAAALRL